MFARNIKNIRNISNIRNIIKSGIKKRLFCENNTKSKSNYNYEYNDPLWKVYYKNPCTSLILFTSSSLIGSGIYLYDNKERDIKRKSLGFLSASSGTIGLLINSLCEYNKVYGGISFGPGMIICFSGSMFGVVITSIFSKKN